MSQMIPKVYNGFIRVLEDVHIHILYLSDAVDHMESDRDVYRGSPMDMGSIYIVSCDTSSAANILLLLLRGKNIKLVRHRYLCVAKSKSKYVTRIRKFHYC